jgi:hypothetical protein
VAIRPFDPIQEILSSGRILFGNLLLAVPNIVAMVVPILIAIVFGVYALVGALMSSRSFADPGAVSRFFTPTLLTGFGLAALVFVVLNVLATGAVYVSSADALAGRPVDVASLVASGLKHAGNVFAFYFILFVVGILGESLVVLLGLISYGVLGVLGFLVLVVAGIYAGFLLMYALPALVLHGLGPVEAMQESAALARANLNSTLTLILAWLVVAAGSLIVNLTFGFIPIFGQIVGLAVQGLCSALIALFSVHFYRLLSGRAEPIATVTVPSAPPPTSAP